MDDHRDDERGHSREEVRERERRYRPQSQAGPITNPVDFFPHLPEETRRMLEQLRPDHIEALESLMRMPEDTRKFLINLRTEDTVQIQEAIKFTRDAKTVSKFTKWIVVAVVLTFGGAVGFGENVLKFLKWFSQGVKP